MIDLFRMLKLDYKEYIILFKSGSFYISFDEDKKIIDCEINDETKKFFCKEIENLDRSALCDCYTIWIKKWI